MILPRRPRQMARSRISFLCPDTIASCSILLDQEIVTQETSVALKHHFQIREWFLKAGPGDQAGDAVIGVSVNLDN